MEHETGKPTTGATNTQSEALIIDFCYRDTLITCLMALSKKLGIVLQNRSSTISSLAIHFTGRCHLCHAWRNGTDFHFRIDPAAQDFVYGYDVVAEVSGFNLPPST